MRYFFWASYDGASYCGWQNQPNALSVQGELERSLSVLAKSKTAIVGAGRTDAGVHARQMVFHADLPIDFSKMDEFTCRLNHILPQQISVNYYAKVIDNAHARFDALSRTYHYYIHTQKDPFLDKFSLRIRRELDIDLMNMGTNYLIGQKDFTSFAKLHTDVKTNICTVREAQWIRISDHSFYFKVTADRFLRNMVRAIVGTLFMVGWKKIMPNELKEIINQQNRGVAGASVPAKALFLESVNYPDNLFLSEKRNIEI